MGSGKTKIPINRKDKKEKDLPAASDGDNERQERAASLEERIVEEFEKELAEARRQADENWDKYLRAVAERENFKKRLTREYQDRLKADKRQLLRKLLDVSDELERALEHADSDDGLAQGVALTYRNLQNVLAAEGVEKIDTVGNRFDPHYHEAVRVVEDGADEEIVVEEIQKGYLYDDRLLRPAKVAVAKPQNS